MKQCYDLISSFLQPWVPAWTATVGFAWFMTSCTTVTQTRFDVESADQQRHVQVKPHLYQSHCNNLTAACTEPSNPLYTYATLFVQIRCIFSKVFSQSPWPFAALRFTPWHNPEQPFWRKGNWNLCSRRVPNLVSLLPGLGFFHFLFDINFISIAVCLVQRFQCMPFDWPSTANRLRQASRHQLLPTIQKQIGILCKPEDTHTEVTCSSLYKTSPLVVLGIVSSLDADLIVNSLQSPFQPKPFCEYQNRPTVSARTSFTCRIPFYKCHCLNFHSL